MGTDTPARGVHAPPFPWKLTLGRKRLGRWEAGRGLALAFDSCRSLCYTISHGGFDQNTGEGHIVLANQEGRAVHFSARRLGLLLADHDPLRLVLLNSCEVAKGSKRDIFSSTASILVRQGIPAVLAMQYEITDQGAIEFARAFYEAVGDGMPVDGAVAQARKAISLAVTNTVE
ncbi:CHAT domain-containing protein [Chloroflexota bacterium]